MEGFQRQVKHPPWTTEAHHLRLLHNACSAPAALKRFPRNAATANAVAAEGCKKTPPSCNRMIIPIFQGPSRIVASGFCERAHPERISSQQQPLRSEMLQSTASSRSHGSQLFPLLTRYFFNGLSFNSNASQHAAFCAAL